MSVHATKSKASKKLVDASDKVTVLQELIYTYTTELNYHEEELIAMNSYDPNFIASDEYTMTKMRKASVTIKALQNKIANAKTQIAKLMHPH